MLIFFSVSTGPAGYDDSKVAVPDEAATTPRCAGVYMFFSLEYDMIDYQTVNSFYAKGNYHCRNISLPVQLTGSYKSFSTDPVDVHIWSEEKKASQIFNDSMRFPYSVYFEGKTENGESICLTGIQPYQITGSNQLKASIGTFINGDIESIAKQTDIISIHSMITSTPLIIPQSLYLPDCDGTISISGNEKSRSGICWNNRHGKAQLIDNYEYIVGENENKGVTLRLKTNSLFLEISPTTEMDLRTVLFKLPQYIDEDLRLLSFIGRKRVVCTEASATFNTGGRSFSAFVRYKTWGGFYSEPMDESILRSLIKPFYLKEGLFDILISKYRESKYKLIIDRTIPYLLTSYEDGYLETHLVNAYAALESMVDGIGDTYDLNYLLGNNQFKRLAKKIEDIICQEIPDEEIGKGIIKKIPELRRRTFLDRLLYLLNTQEVDTNLIWPPKIDETIEFHEILKRRSLLIHTGKVDIDHSGEFDLSRVQKLVELWILKLLDCPHEAINQFGLWRDAPINELLHY